MRLATLGRSVLEQPMAQTSMALENTGFQTCMVQLSSRGDKLRHLRIMADFLLTSVWSGSSEHSSQLAFDLGSVLARPAPLGHSECCLRFGLSLPLFIPDDLDLPSERLLRGQLASHIVSWHIPSCCLLSLLAGFKPSSSVFRVELDVPLLLG